MIPFTPVQIIPDGYDPARQVCCPNCGDDGFHEPGPGEVLCFNCGWTGDRTELIGEEDDAAYHH